MRTAAICPTCATYENAVCIIYNGTNLTNINVPTLTNLETSLINIDNAVGSLSAYIDSVAANPIVLTTDGTSGPATLIGNLLNVPNYQPTLQDVVWNDPITNQDIYVYNDLITPTIHTGIHPNGIEIKDYTLPTYTTFNKDYIRLYDQSTTNESYINLPNANNNAAYDFPATGGTLALISDVTLQTVTSGTNKNLTDGFNFQGTGAGDSNTGITNINAFGTDAAKNNSGSGNINAFGRRAAQDNTGDNVNVLGIDSGNLNTGDHINALGGVSAYNNSGDYVNALGPSAGANNTYSYVNLLGYSASASADNQLVLSKNMGSQMARIGYGGISADRLYTLPDASGTLALTSDIPGYKEFVAILTSSGVSLNVAVIKNTLGGSVTTASYGTGPYYYYLVSSGLFTDNTVVFIGSNHSNDGTKTVKSYRTSSNVVELYGFTGSTLDHTAINGVCIEIRVYP